MKAIIVFIFDQRDVPRGQAPRWREIKTLPNRTTAPNPAASFPFWTWFIENPRIDTSREITA
ncbi:MAG: hypothetical protein ACJ8HQ_03260 [Chthoniobacterales bacterium]